MGSVAILAIILLISASCTDEQARKLAIAADDISIGVGAAIDAKRLAREKGWISDSEELVITKALLDVNHAGTQFGINARKITKLDGNSKAEMIDLFRQLNFSVQVMNRNIKSLSNPEAQVKIQSTTAIIEIALASIQAIVGGP
jgi:hypothetical protein